jgi:C-terminal processing protease CtpA/Prc
VLDLRDSPGGALTAAVNFVDLIQTDGLPRKAKNPRPTSGEGFGVVGFAR